MSLDHKYLPFIIDVDKIGLLGVVLYQILFTFDPISMYFTTLDFPKIKRLGLQYESAYLVRLIYLSSSIGATT